MCDSCTTIDLSCRLCGRAIRVRAGTGRRGGVQARLRTVSRQPRRRLARPQSGRASQAHTRSGQQCIDDWNDAAAGRRSHRPRAPRGRAVPGGSPAGRLVGGSDCGSVPDLNSHVRPCFGRSLERMGRWHHQYALSASGTGWADGGAGAESQAQVGLRLSGRDVGTFAARGGRRPVVRGERQRRGVQPRPTDRLHSLDLPCRSRHTECARRGAACGTWIEGIRGLLRGWCRQRLRTRCVERQATLDEKARRPSTGSRDRLTDIARRSVVCAHIGPRRGRSGWAGPVPSAARSAGACRRFDVATGAVVCVGTRSPRNPSREARTRKVCRHGGRPEPESGRRRRSTSNGTRFTSALATGIPVRLNQRPML